MIKVATELSEACSFYCYGVAEKLQPGLEKVCKDSLWKAVHPSQFFPLVNKEKHYGRESL